MRMRWSLAVILALALNYASGSGRFPSLGQSLRIGKYDAADSRRFKRSPTVSDRPSCADGVNNESPIVVNTSIQLEKFRAAMTTAAYVIPMADNHQSEYVSDYDKRVQFISGFSGSAGTAVVTATKAALWADGRYFLQADQELDCNWILMKQGEPGVPEPEEWLIEELGLNEDVGADPSLLSYDAWTKMRDTIKDSSKQLVLKSRPDVVDGVWDNNQWTPARPPRPNNNLIILEMEFAGESWQDKVARLRQWMGDSIPVGIVTYLDEIAWLFNLRGTDISYNPVFFAFAIVEKGKVTLYLEGKATRLTTEVQQHLNTDANGNCANNNDCVWVKEYSEFLGDITVATAALTTTEKVWVSPMSSQGVYEALDSATQAFQKASAVRTMKGRKNQVEIDGLRRCHKRDSVAVIQFLTKLEREIKEGKTWNEMTAQEELLRFRKETDFYQTESFEPISGSGPNGAVIHYRPTEETNRQITTSDMYLLDSGGQYLDGTTDVTRTLHFGTPTDFQKEAYTRVLMGAIDLATTIWANGTYGRDIDAIAREPLWSVGLDYRHGTGHGIGAFLNVHEGPGRINIGYRGLEYEEPMYGSMFFSDEPGYYEDGEFGIRLETIVMTKKLDLPYEFGDKDYLGFEAFTLVPFEPNLIKYDLMSKKELKWLNEYNARIRQEISEELLSPAGLTAEYNWVQERTQHIDIDESLINSASAISSAFSYLFCVFSIIVLY